MMVNLGDYLGHLLSEITKARVQADLEAVRVANFYASDPLLKNFPIPRMRLPNLELNVPVIISEVPGDKDDSSPDKISSETIVSESERIVKEELNNLDIKLSPGNISSIRRALLKKAKTDDKLLKKETTKEYISKEMAGESIRVVKGLRRGIDPKKIESLRANINNKLHVTLINLEKKPERIEIIPQTSKIKEVGNIDNVVTLKLSITEDAIEWAAIDNGDDDKTEKILVPE